MAFSSGFFNSKNHDRQYYNMDVSRLFDGLIRDGIFASIGTCFVVTPNHDFTVSVGIGRAWFNHTWSYNDSIMPVELEQSEILMDRIDAIVLEINEEEAVRENSIKVIKGTPSSNPVKPELIKTLYVHQYPLAYVRLPEASTSIRQADIENAVGTEACPFVSGILEVISIDQLIPQWRDILNRFVEENTSAFNTWWNDLMATSTNNWNDFLQWEQESQEQFQSWFDNLKYLLSGDVATKLTVEVDILKNQMTEVNTKITEVEENTLKTPKTYKIELTSSSNWSGINGSQQVLLGDSCNMPELLIPENERVMIVGADLGNAFNKKGYETFQKAMFWPYINTIGTPNGPIKYLFLICYGEKPDPSSLPLKVVVTFLHN